MWMEKTSIRFGKFTRCIPNFNFINFERNELETFYGVHWWHSHNFEKHLGNWADVFKCLDKYNLRLQLKKCHFAVDQEKRKAMKDFPVLKTQKQVESFLGLHVVDYYRKFVPNFLKIAFPLNSFLCKDKKFIWSQECQTSFETLKQKLFEAPILAFLKTTFHFKLWCVRSKRFWGKWQLFHYTVR